MGMICKPCTMFAAAAAAMVALAGAGYQAVASGQAAAQPKAAAPAPKSAKVGEKAPDFTLADLSGTQHTLSNFAKEGKIVVLEWFNPDCPYVVKHHEQSTTMADLAKEYGSKSVVWIAVNSGAPGKQGAGAERNQKAVRDWEIAYPVLLDETGVVGKAYDAKTTPHMFIIDKDGVLRYNGAIDNGARGNADKNYVKQALDQILAGETVTEPETRPYGCSVKYAN